MPPKKEVKKQPVIEEPPKVVQPQIPAHQLQGYGRFQYQNGSFYQGDWKLFRGVKQKYGKGKLFIKQGLSGLKQTYDGSWVEDQMSGQGTYVFADGSKYSGNWKQNKRNGFGIYEFPNGTLVEGEWDNNLLNGSGMLIDHYGKKWEGEFKNGIYQSSRQAELIKQKTIIIKKKAIRTQLQQFLSGACEILSKSDKKTLKQNFSPYFGAVETLKQIAKQPYSKFDERPAQKWTELLNLAKIGTFNILGSPNDAIFLTADKVLASQMSGKGQVVQISSVKDEKTVKIALILIQNNKWAILLVQEEEKKQDKKK